MIAKDLVPIPGSVAYLGLVTGLVLAGQEDALAEEGEGCASVHLAFDQFGAGVEAFDAAGAPGHGQGVADGLVVAADAVGERGELGLAGAGPCGGEPVVQAGSGVVAGAAGEDLGECGDVPGQGVQFGAASED